MIRLTGRVRHYEWGSPSAIPELAGLPQDGRPVAELWFGAHPDDPSGTPEGPLDAVLAAHPELLGDRHRRLPYLVKLLAARSPLSLQVHPSADQAAAGYADEEARGVPKDAVERRYRDPYAKPELLYALTLFEALCSFRAVADTLDLLQTLDVAELAPTIAALRSPGGVRQAMVELFELDEPERKQLAETVCAGCRNLAGRPGRWQDEARMAMRVGDAHPGDVGVVIALLLNYLRLRPGEAIFVGAGQVHAYLDGLGVEVLASSDNVLRCGLTPKYIDVDELLRIAAFEPVPVTPMTSSTLVPPVTEFRVQVLSAGQALQAEPGAPALVLCTDGAAELAGGRLGPGQAGFLGAGERLRSVTSTGQVLVVVPNLT